MDVPVAAALPSPLLAFNYDIPEDYMEQVMDALKLDLEARTMGPGGRGIRFTDDRPRRFSVLDTISILTGKSSKHTPEWFRAFMSGNTEVSRGTPLNRGTSY